MIVPGAAQRTAATTTKMVRLGAAVGTTLWAVVHSHRKSGISVVAPVVRPGRTLAAWSWRGTWLRLWRAKHSGWLMP